MHTAKTIPIENDNDNDDDPHNTFMSIHYPIKKVHIFRNNDLYEYLVTYSAFNQIYYDVNIYKHSIYVIFALAKQYDIGTRYSFLYVLNGSCLFTDMIPYFSIHSNTDTFSSLICAVYLIIDAFLSDNIIRISDVIRIYSNIVKNNTNLINTNCFKYAPNITLITQYQYHILKYYDFSYTKFLNKYKITQFNEYDVLYE